MKFEIRAELEYEFLDSGTLILNIQSLKTPAQNVLTELVELHPKLTYQELTPAHHENRLLRIIGNGPQNFRIVYSATVENGVRLIDLENIPDFDIADIPADVLPFLYPSRYCQSDKLFRFAQNKFGNIESPYLQVCALTDWIYQNVVYLSGSTNAQTSAYETVTEFQGVCRDFAHLGIALCRALTIPARYMAAYAFQLKPADFHACFEAYIGGQWLVFDATRLAPLNGLVKIARGRDAADTAFANIFGNVSFLAMSVNVSSLDEQFDPVFYSAGEMQGAVYD